MWKRFKQAWREVVEWVGESTLIQSIRTYLDGVFTPSSLMVSAFFLSLILIPPGIYAAPSLDDPYELTGTTERPRTGDSFRLTSGGADYTVRLHGVSVREQRKPVPGAEDPQSPEDPAQAALATLLTDGPITCTRRLPDTQGRYVARCTVSGDRDLAAALIARGTVKEDCFVSGNAYGTCAVIPATLGWVTASLTHIGANILLPGIRSVVLVIADGGQGLWSLIRPLFYKDLPSQSDTSRGTSP